MNPIDSYLDWRRDDSPATLLELEKWAFSDSPEKVGRISGARVPGDVISEPTVPYRQRRKVYRKYLRTKSQERPTSLPRALGVGGLLGAGTGALLGASAGPGGAGVGALAGSALGLIVGLAARAADKGEIARASNILLHGGLDESLAHEIARHKGLVQLGHELDKDRRHRELIGAIERRER